MVEAGESRRIGSTESKSEIIFSRNRPPVTFIQPALIEGFSNPSKFMIFRVNFLNSLARPGFGINAWQ